MFIGQKKHPRKYININYSCLNNISLFKNCLCDTFSDVTSSEYLRGVDKPLDFIICLFKKSLGPAKFSIATACSVLTQFFRRRSCTISAKLAIFLFRLRILSLRRLIFSAAWHIWLPTPSLFHRVQPDKIL